jgi:hypothetical protein
MTWTYDSTDLSTDLAKVRLHVGDTNTNDQLLTDEEINYALSLETAILLASARCCDFIVSKLARDIDRSNIGMNAQRSQKIQHYMDLAVRLRQEYSTSSDGLGEVFVGGVSDANNQTLADDSDYRQAVFQRDQDTHQ